MDKNYIRLLILFFILILLMFLLIFLGPVSISVSNIFKILLGFEDVPKEHALILLKLRLPKMITALLAGSAMAVSGLIMQTYFSNPLAGPFVLGIHGGASLGVAVGIMIIGALKSFIPIFLLDLSIVGFSIFGSTTMLLLLLIISNKISGRIVLLVMGLVFGHVATGIINIIVVISDAQRVKTFLLWNLGSFQRISSNQLLIFSVVIILSLLVLSSFTKQMNLFLLGPRYASTSGMSVNKFKFVFLIITSLLSGTVTAYCGPIAFIGIITPHMIRKWFDSANHAWLLPGAILLGAIIAMFAEFISGYMGTTTIPINAVLGLLGAPFIFIFLMTVHKGDKYGST